MNAREKKRWACRHGVVDVCMSVAPGAELAVTGNRGGGIVMVFFCPVGQPEEQEEHGSLLPGGSGVRRELLVAKIKGTEPLFRPTCLEHC